MFALLGCETKPAAPRNAALPTISLDEEQIHAHDQGPSKPTLVLLLAEFGLNSHTLRAGVGSFDERPTADTLVDQLISEGWNCVNAEPSVRRSVSVKDAATAFSVASVQAECRRSKADVALVGSVVATTPGPSEIAAGMMPATAYVSLRAVDCKSDQVLTTLSKSYGDITTLDVNGHSASVKAFRRPSS